MFADFFRLVFNMADEKMEEKVTLTEAGSVSSGIDHSDIAGLGNFKITLDELNDLMSHKELQLIKELNEKHEGVSGLIKKLKSSSVKGLMGISNDLENRVALFGKNYILPKPPKAFWMLVWEALEDTILRILIAAAIVSLVLGMIIESVETGWIDGFAILVAVAVVSLVTAVNDWQKEKQFRQLQGKIDKEQTVDVIRGGESETIQVTELVVGDVCQLKYGDLVPADGILLQGNDVKVDESSLTGESDQVKKTFEKDIGLFSGTHIMEGSCKYLITAVGEHSQAGKIMVLLGAGEKKQEEEGKKATENKAADGEALLEEVDLTDKSGEHKPKEEEEKEKSILQNKLTKLALTIGWMGVGAATITTLVILIRFCVEKYGIQKEGWNNKHLLDFLNAFIVGVTIMVVAIPEGLPLAVTISLAYSVKKMLLDNNLVRHLDACETMGNATAICSDKTGTLTTNRMTVVESYLQGTHYKEVPSSGTFTRDFLDLFCSSVAINSNYGSRIEVIEFIFYFYFSHMSSGTDLIVIDFFENFNSTIFVF